MRSSAGVALLAGVMLAGGAALAQTIGPETCAACHGPNGNSVVPAIPSIAGQPRVFLENQLVLIREGLRDVPAMKAVMGSVNDEQIVALARHFTAQAVAAPQAQRQPDKFKAGAEVANRALCGTCHLPAYVGQNQVPRLAGQSEAYLLPTMKMYRDQPEPGRDTAMSAALYGLTDGDLDALAHYLAQQGR